MNLAHLAIAWASSGLAGSTLAATSTQPDYTATVALARQLFEGKSFIRSDGVRGTYSEWHDLGSSGYFNRVMIIPQVADPVDVTETLSLESEAVVMIEDVPLVQKHATFAVTLTERGG